MNFYLNKYGFQPPAIEVKPDPKLGIIVVIPCFNEPDLISSLEALCDCHPTHCGVEVIVVINSGIHHSETVKAQNQKTYERALNWSVEQNNTGFSLHFIVEDKLPKKQAGVGLARKIGMDEAVHRFSLIEKDGIIVCFDADALCDSNYLIEIERHFVNNPKTPGCSIHYEHPLEGEEFSPEIYRGIINYELHLRYYNQALKFAGLPYAYHTVGSSMAVRSSAYQKQGGMNKRKAGEDFYFIHKIIALGDFSELKTTRVIPSPRISDRVPFGTGKAIGDWIKTEAEVFETYAFKSFLILKTFVKCIPDLYTQSLEECDLSLESENKQLLIDFLEDQKFETSLIEIRKNSKEQKAFIKRFFRWFDAFRILKLVHFFRDNGLSNGSVHKQTGLLLHQLGFSQMIENEKDQLLFLRQFEKK